MKTRLKAAAAVVAAVAVTGLGISAASADTVTSTYSAKLSGSIAASSNVDVVKATDGSTYLDAHLNTGRTASHLYKFVIKVAIDSNNDGAIDSYNSVTACTFYGSYGWTGCSGKVGLPAGGRLDRSTAQIVPSGSTTIVSSGPYVRV